MATSKTKRPVLLAQPKPQHAKNARTAIPDYAKSAQSGNPGAGSPGSQRRSPNPEQILRPKHGLRISPAGSDARKAAQPTELLPVKAHAYRAIAELNGGFEKVVRDLQTVGEISYFRSDRVRAMYDLICRIRAQANRDFILALHHREAANVGHFERLCIQWEKEIGGPSADS